MIQKDKEDYFKKRWMHIKDKKKDYYQINLQKKIVKVNLLRIKKIGLKKNKKLEKIYSQKKWNYYQQKKMMRKQKLRKVIIYLNKLICQMQIVYKKN